jgi:hypothetical protein
MLKTYKSGQNKEKTLNKPNLSLGVTAFYTVNVVMSTEFLEIRFARTVGVELRRYLRHTPPPPVTS